MMAGPTLLIFVVLSILICSCQCLRITGTMDAEYRDYAAFEMEKKLTCYLKVAIKQCPKGADLKVYFKNDDENKTISGKQGVCVPVKCTSSGASSEKRFLSTTIDIGGINLKASPDQLNEGYKGKGLYRTEEKCKPESSSPASTVICKEKKRPKFKGKNLEFEEFDEMFSDKQEDDPESVYDMQNDGTQSKNSDYASVQDYITAAEDMNEPGPPEDSSMQDENDDDEKTENLGEALAELQHANVGEHETAKIQWNNWFKHNMYVNCGNRRAIYWVRSAHSTHYHDRIWYFACKYVTNLNYNHCYWTGYQNSYDYPLFAQCGYNYVLTGLYSRYSNYHGDRQYSLLCCRAPYYYTKTCYMTGFINGWNGWMNYAVGGSRVFTGLYSYHANSKEDRIWKVSSCYYVR